MRDIFDKKNWPSMWSNAMRVSKRARTEDTLLEKEWYQEHLNEEGEYADPDSLIFIEGNYVYTVDPHENTVTACNVDGNCVGKLNIATGEDNNLWLDHVSVSPNFQNQGIGTQLVRLAVLHLDDFFVAGVQESDDYAFSLTGGGENLISACLRNRFITGDRILFPPEIPLSEGVEVDPGLIVGSGEIGDIYTERTREEDASSLDGNGRMTP